MTSSRHVRWLTAGVAIMALTAALTAAPAPSQGQSFYTEAGKPYAGTTIRVLDEITPLQETLSKIVPEFEKETGIKVEWELLNHFEVISKGQADMVSGRGYYDAVMLHGFQMGPMLTAGVIRPIDDLVKNPKLSNPALNQDDFIQGPYKSTSFYKGKQYGFVNWNYNQVYWARADLLNDPTEQAAFKAKYGYDLAPAKTIEPPVVTVVVLDAPATAPMFRNGIELSVAGFVREFVIVRLPPLMTAVPVQVSALVFKTSVPAPALMKPWPPVTLD